MYIILSTSRVCNPAPFTPLTSSLHLFIYSFIHLFIQLFINSSIHSFIILFNLSFIHIYLLLLNHSDIFSKFSTMSLHIFKIEEDVKNFIFHLNLVLNLKISLLTPSSNPDICPVPEV